MTTISLPSDVERPLTDEAQRLGTTPELLAVETLRKVFAPAAPSNGVGHAQNLLEFLGDFVGSVCGTGEPLSENCGERFAEGMLEKKRQGRL